jgi:hypothetical protein
MTTAVVHDDGAARDRRDPRPGKRAGGLGGRVAAFQDVDDDPAWTGFIRRMEAASPEFAAMWATQDVAQPASHAKVFRHPRYPRLAMTATSLGVQTAPGTPMVVYAPADDATGEPWSSWWQNTDPLRRSRVSPAGRPTRPGRWCPSPSKPQFRVDPRKALSVTDLAFCTRSDESGDTINHPVITGCDLE